MPPPSYFYNISLGKLKYIFFFLSPKSQLIAASEITIISFSSIFHLVLNIIGINTTYIVFQLPARNTDKIVNNFGTFFHTIHFKYRHLENYTIAVPFSACYNYVMSATQYNGRRLVLHQRDCDPLIT